MSRADEEIALIESLRKRGKSQSAAAKEAAAAMKAKDISEAEALEPVPNARAAGLAYRAPLSIPEDIASQRILLDQARSELTKRDARLRRIERRFTQLRDSVAQQKRESTFGESIFDARLAAWADTAASAGSCCAIDDMYQNPALSLESGAAAAIAADLRSMRADVDVVVHLGTPFDGPKVLAEVRSALATTKVAGTNPIRAKSSARFAAANLARAAIRHAWTQPTARAALSHGSHLLLASLGCAMSVDASNGEDPKETFEAAQVRPLYIVVSCNNTFES